MSCAVGSKAVVLAQCNEGKLDSRPYQPHSFVAVSGGFFVCGDSSTVERSSDVGEVAGSNPARRTRPRSSMDRARRFYRLGWRFKSSRGHLWYGVDIAGCGEAASFVVWNHAAQVRLLPP